MPIDALRYHEGRLQFKTPHDHEWQNVRPSQLGMTAPPPEVDVPCGRCGFMGMTLVAGVCFGCSRALDLEPQAVEMLRRAADPANWATSAPAPDEPLVGEWWTDHNGDTVLVLSCRNLDQGLLAYKCLLITPTQQHVVNCRERKHFAACLGLASPHCPLVEKI